MLIGYVSDEFYSALPDTLVEFEWAGGTIATRSSASGAIHAEVPFGPGRVTLAREGFGSKWVNVDLQPGRLLQFRLLSHRLYGYAWPKWQRSGGQSEVRLHSPEPFHLSLWRYGWKKECVQSLGWFDEHGPWPNLQILPDTDFTQCGVGWNRFGYDRQFDPSGDRTPGRASLEAPLHSPAHAVIAPARSGLYYFHAETESGKFLSFPWIVAPAKPQARIAVLASSNTWNAYNNFGGRSNYINPTGLPPQPTINARLDLARYVAPGSVWSARDDEYPPLSFDRPEPFNHIPRGVEVTDPIRGRQACHLAEAEWRLLGWLEREGFACDVYSDYQLHAGELPLTAYDILIISTHPEYWSREAYFRVKEWVFKQGGRLLYLGGNGIDCEVEFLDAATLRCRTWLPNPNGALQFIEPGTGRLFDCRFHHKVESPAELLGVVFTEPGCGTSAPFQVKNASHWIYEGTHLRDGDFFGSHSLHERCPHGASGHETDKRTAATPKNAVLLAQGTNANGGGAEMLLHETASGGAVFSVGSITWPACLLVDEAVSRITRNVLHRFCKHPRS